MPKCPRCGKEIDHLIEYSKEWRKYRVRLVGNYIEYEEIDEAAVVIDHEYVCPECDSTIAITEEGAKEFLRSE
jgi:DNA-directed RNA polymerase subunit RPC12/RpoP